MAEINKPKIYSLIKNQVPEFVREDYPLFISFLEAYYEYLQSIDVDIEDARDIERTADEFLEYFKAELAYTIPNLELVDERFFITKIKDLYEAKGSEASYKFLFRLLFDKDVGIAYPSQQILRCDDGKWNKDTSIFVKVEYGNPNDIVGRNVEIVSPDKIISVFIDRTQEVTVDIDGIVQISPDIFEIFIDRSFFGGVEVGNRLQYEDTFRGEILATTVDFEIQQRGKGFKAGQLFHIQSGEGVGSILKIKRVGAEGEILAAEFVKYGVGYKTDFGVTLFAQEQEEGVLAGYQIIGTDLFIGDVVDSFSEYGFLNNYDYNIEVGDTPAISESYAGEIIREFSSSGYGGQVSDPSELAIISIKLGSLADYPGYYSTNDGFLDDAIYLQDDRYYQSFSYVIQTDLMLSEYGSILKDILHPAGMALFGDYRITNNFDLSIFIESAVKTLSVLFTDFFSLDSNITSKDFGKALDDSFDLISNEPIKDFGKALVDEGFDLDSNITAKDFGKALVDEGFDLDSNITAKDFGKALGDNFDLTSNEPIKDFGKALDDSFSLLDDHNILLNKSLSDSFGLISNVSEIQLNKVSFDSFDLNSEITDKSFGKSLTDFFNTSDSINYSFAKYIDDSFSVSESISVSLTHKGLSTDTNPVTESGNLFLNPYMEFPDTYWGEDYTEGTYPI